MASEHTAKAFDSDLQELTRLVAEMGGLAERMITESVDALVRRDVALGKRVVAADVEIDRLQHLIEERAVLTIARRQPMAIDLREIVGAMRVATDLERIGDMAVNFCERTLELNEEPQLKPYIDIPRMATTAQSMLRDALDSYVRGDMQLAQHVLDEDDVLDSLKTQVFRELLTYMLQDPATIEPALDLILISRHLERIGDHATNIAEDVIFMVSGRDVRHHAADHQTG